MLTDTVDQVPVTSVQRTHDWCSLCNEHPSLCDHVLANGIILRSEAVQKKSRAGRQLVRIHGLFRWWVLHTEVTVTRFKTQRGNSFNDAYDVCYFVSIALQSAPFSAWMADDVTPSPNDGQMLSDVQCTDHWAAPGVPAGGGVVCP